MSKFLGIDYGDKHLGLAIADEETRIASPYKILPNNDDNLVIGQISRIVIDEEIKAIIIGLPKGMQGQASAQLAKVNSFIELLKNNFSQEIIAEDERLTTAMAGGLMKEDKKSGERDDAVAAMLILQSYLDKK